MIGGNWSFRCKSALKVESLFNGQFNDTLDCLCSRGSGFSLGCLDKLTEVLYKTLARWTYKRIQFFCKNKNSEIPRCNKGD